MTVPADAQLWEVEALAAGIPLWPGAKVVHKEAPDYNRALRYDDAQRLLATAEGWTQDFDGCRFVPDLTDSDTLAAFDRRLALRLGATEDQASRGVVVFRFTDGEGRIDYVGIGADWMDGIESFGWRGADIDHERGKCLILARIRMWASALTTR